MLCGGESDDMWEESADLWLDVAQNLSRTKPASDDETQDEPVDFLDELDDLLTKPDELWDAVLIGVVDIFNVNSDEWEYFKESLHLSFKKIHDAES